MFRKRTDSIRLLTLLAVGGASALTACTTATPYEPKSASSSSMPYGYSDQQLSPGVYRVDFSGNSYTDRATVENYLLYRAAQLTQQQGYSGFAIERENTDKKSHTDVERTPVGLGWGGFAPYWGFYGRWGYRPYNPWIGGPFYGDTVSVDQINKYDAHAVIRMYNGAAPAGAQKTFTASEVLSSLGPTIKEPKQS